MGGSPHWPRRTNSAGPGTSLEHFISLHVRQPVNCLLLVSNLDGLEHCVPLCTLERGPSCVGFLAQLGLWDHYGNCALELLVD